MLGDPVPHGRKGWSELSVEYDRIDQEMDSANLQYGGTLTSEHLLLRGTYGLSSKTDLFLLLGGGDAETEQRAFNGSMQIAFGGGARWKLFELGDLQVGAGLQALHFFSRDGDAIEHKMTLTRVDADLGGSLSGLPFFRPYGGLLVTRADGKFYGGETARIHSQNWVGFFVGGDFLIWDRFRLGTEWVLGNEYAYGVRLIYRF
jgi:hypothetical protein